MDTESMPAWTLPELLVVMILSGLIFLALSEATDLVGRFTGYLTERWVRTEGELSACHRLDELISRTDSIAVQDAGLHLYCRILPWLFCRYPIACYAVITGIEKIPCCAAWKR